MVARSETNGRRGTRLPRRLLRQSFAVGLLCALVVPATPGGAQPVADESRREQGTGRMSAQAAGKTVSIKGWATFSGAVIAGATDKKSDGQPNSAAAEENGAEIIEGQWIYRPELEDFFVRLELTKIPTVAGTGGPGLVGKPTTLYVFHFNTPDDSSYQIRAHNMGNPNAGEGQLPTDAAFGLFKCGEVECLKVADLKGGYGTAGEKIVVALPLKTLKDLEEPSPVKEGDTISGLRAEIVFGTFNDPIKQDTVVYDDMNFSKDGKAKVPKKSVRVTVKNKTVRAKLDKGYFDAPFPKRLFKKKGKTPVRTKTCLGKKCVKQTFKIKV